jgi:hypothetical protein
MLQIRHMIGQRLTDGTTPPAFRPPFPQSKTAPHWNRYFSLGKSLPMGQTVPSSHFSL